MNSYTVKVLIFFLSLFILITISSQIYLAFQDNYKTETAISYSATEKVSFKGIFVRNESVLNYDGTGVIYYPNPDGSKIAKNSVVAYVYNSENDIDVNQSITKINQELELLNKAQNKGTAEVAQPEFISKLIQEKYQTISDCIEKNDLTKLKSEKTELNNLLNIMQIVTGKEENFNERIKFLNTQLSTLNAQKKEPLKALTVEKPGYFVSYTDGYEDKLKLDSLESITTSDIKNVINSKPSLQKNNIGKIIDGYSWKMVGIIDNSSNRFTKGMKVKLNLSSVSHDIKATIDNIKNTNNSKESIVILSCDNLTYDLVQNRVERVDMMINDFEGIKVPREAIRFINGEKGVYVRLGQGVTFKKIKVIFEDQDFVISENSGKNGFLLLYDDIITEGISGNDIKSSITEGTSITDESKTVSSQSSSLTDNASQSDKTTTSQTTSNSSNESSQSAVTDGD